MPRTKWNGPEAQDGYEISVQYGVTGSAVKRVEPAESDATAPGEFTSFTRLAQKLIGVPKSEIDEKRKTS